MTIQRLDQFVALFLILFGLYLVWTGIGYGYMQGTTPGAGFFPAVFGVVLAVLSLINLVRSLIGAEVIKADVTVREVAKTVGIIVAIAIFIVLIPLLGMTMAAMLLMLAVGLILRPRPEPRHLVRLGLVSVLLPIACLALFERVLDVPVPTGPLGF